MWDVEGNEEVRLFTWGGVFPLGINPSMDQHAADNGFPHWSCTEPSSNMYWIRKDGEVCIPTFAGPQGYLTDLSDIDQRIPLRS